MPEVSSRSFIRWMQRTDMAAVLEAERAALGLLAWTGEDFLHCLRSRNCIGMVAERGPRFGSIIMGHMVYEMHRTRLEILCLTVHPNFHRIGVGSDLIAKLRTKLGRERTALRVHVRESLLQQQMFYRAQGFKAVRVERGFFSDTGEDGYRMEWRA